MAYSPLVYSFSYVLRTMKVNTGMGFSDFVSFHSVRNSTFHEYTQGKHGLS